MLSTLCETFADFDILRWFELIPDVEGSPEITKGGLLADMCADKASEETWDREEAFEE